MRFKMLPRVKNKKPIIFNASKIYRNIFFTVLSILMLTQLALTTPGARAVLTFTEKIEGVFAGAEDSGHSLAEMTLVLSGAEPSFDIEVLQNGSPIAVFYDRTITVTVSDNCVLEIDGRKIKQPFSVQVAEVSPSIDTENIQREADVNSNISLIGRIFIK